MRLLNTSTIKFREFPSEDVPRYAILSHTWGKEEVSFQDMQNGTAEGKAGFEKIKSCCTLAARDGWNYVWIDTCCIDKSSSAELSQAINSMFEWYQSAAVCFAYLVDVPDAEADHHDEDSPFRNSRWFTRGWTLQELLAPMTVVFYDYWWKEIGTKSSLSDAISEITGIRRSHMINFKDVNVAVKMSWASKRKTTRTEDIAYCLMGIFNIHMPLLYGEGKNAFLRLQLEILKMSDDETIFAWGCARFFVNWGTATTGLLAPSPFEFYGSGDIRQIIFDTERPVYSMTNKGLRIELLLWRTTEVERADMKVYLAPLNCTQHPEDLPIVIYLQTGLNNASNVGIDFTRYFPKGPRLMTLPKEYLGSKYKEIKRNIVYVKQFDIPEGWKLSPFLGGILKIRYPLEHWQIIEARHFSLFEGNGRHGSSTENWRSLGPGEDILGDFTPETGYGVMLHSTGNHRSGNLVVLAGRTRAGNVTDVVAADGTKTLEKVGFSFMSQENQVNGSDRTSLRLGGGSSVSVALRPVGSPENASHEVFVLDITVTPDSDTEEDDIEDELDSEEEMEVEMDRELT